MNRLLKFIAIFFVLGLISCRETKKEEETPNAAIEQIEAVEKEAEEISKEIEKESEDLKNQLNELDNL